VSSVYQLSSLQSVNLLQFHTEPLFTRCGFESEMRYCMLAAPINSVIAKTNFKILSFYISSYLSQFEEWTADINDHILTLR